MRSKVTCRHCGSLEVSLGHVIFCFTCLLMPFYLRLYQVSCCSWRFVMLFDLCRMTWSYQRNSVGFDVPIVVFIFRRCYIHGQVGLLTWLVCLLSLEILISCEMWWFTWRVTCLTKEGACYVCRLLCGVGVVGLFLNILFVLQSCWWVSEVHLEFNSALFLCAHRLCFVNLLKEYVLLPMCT